MLLWNFYKSAVNKLELYHPRLEDLWFYQRMLSDPQTMSYNAGWNVSYDGYHQETGCVDFPKEKWEEWYNLWQNQEPQRFYAYIKRCSDGKWIGDVNFHYNEEKDWWDMGIVIHASYRGKGYAVPALKLMLDEAFRHCDISRIHNDFEISRNEVAAWKTHLAAGFRDIGTENGIRHMMLTREEYLAKP